jgi:hypothetical protein
MIESLKFIYEYILIGIHTGLALITNTPPPENTLPPVPFSQEYKSPMRKLEFLFDTPVKKPYETKTVSEKATTTNKEIIVKKVKEVPPKKTVATENKVIDKVVTNIDDAVINILCVEKIGNLARSTTGSGVIISAQGLIITNAHVAIDLRKPSNICTIRTGNLAKNAYKAEVLYIPEEWEKNNKDYINAGIVQSSTGEHDFALLQIVGSATNAKLPFSFNFININKGKLSKGDEINTIGYPAERVGLFSSNSNLYRINNTTSIKGVYSFGETSTDLISTGKVSNAEQGSSGGAIMKNGELVGIIANVSGGTINGLSIGYIKRYFESDTGEYFVK